MPHSTPLKIFEKLYGLPSWNVRQGYSSCLTFEFGMPHQEIRPVKTLRGKEPSRTVVIRGDWHLWIYGCDWQILQGPSVLADSESDDVLIARACATLDGQALSEVKLDTEQFSTEFQFDLGGILRTSPFEKDEDDEDPMDQWLLFCQDKCVLTYCSDGTFT